MGFTISCIIKVINNLTYYKNIQKKIPNRSLNMGTTDQLLMSQKQMGITDPIRTSLLTGHICSMTKNCHEKGNFLTAKIKAVFFYVIKK